jgi:hypothetical protein
VKYLFHRKVGTGEKTTFETLSVAVEWKNLKLSPRSIRVDYHIRTLKGQCLKIIEFRFFSWISFPQAPEYPIRPFKICSQIQREIFAAQGAPTVSRTLMANEKKSLIRTVLIILLGHLWVVHLTYLPWYHWHRWRIRNLPLVSTTPAPLVAKFAPGVIYRWCTLRISPRIF